MDNNMDNIGERYQRNIAICLKMIEIQKLMESFSRQAIAMKNGDGAEFQQTMLLALREQTPIEKREQIDMMISMLNMKDMMNKMKEVNV